MKPIKRSKLIRHFSLDVEADGQVAGLYNMINFGISSLADPKVGFYGEVYPNVESAGIPEARAVSGVSWERQLGFPSAHLTMKECAKWLLEQTGGERPLIWSDNPGFDWGFFNYYMWKFTGSNVCGHSCRRFNDFVAGVEQDMYATRRWKRLGTTPHDHNPLNDARRNAEAFVKFLENSELICD